MSVDQERLAALPAIHLDPGTHRAFDQGHCALEVVSWLAGEPFSDTPVCVSPMLRDYVTHLNDGWDDEQRQLLVPYLPRMVGTAGDGKDEARAWLALDWLVRTYTPAWLDTADDLHEHAERLRGLARISGPPAAADALPTTRAARDAAAAAGDAAWDAARATAWVAAGVAAGDVAARATAWDVARATAWDVARATAWDVALAAAGDVAAGAAAWDAARATQLSALDLLNRMINPEDPS